MTLTSFREQRARTLERLAGEESAAVFFSGAPTLRNGDTHHRFRPASDFFYLTGFREPEAALVLVPQASKAQAILFLRERNPGEEVWTGRRLGLEAAVGTLGVDAALPWTELWSKLPELLKGARRLVYRSGEDEARDRRVLDVLARLRTSARNGTRVPLECVDPALSVHELRVKKNAAEIECMRRAAAISAEAHLLALGAARPGMNEGEVEALVESTFRRRGASGAAYPSIVAGGSNACILHYIENDRALASGDLLLLDAGAEWNFYASDVTRTWPIGPRFSPEQRSLYDLVLDAEEAAIAAIAPGASFQAAHDVAVARLTEGLVALGLLVGPADQAIESGSYRRFFMHRTSHWLGLDVHDCGATHVGGDSRVLEAGMVLTVEPGLYVAQDDAEVDARWRGLGIRIEDDVLVIPGGREVLTAAIPKSVQALEELRGRVAPVAVQ